MNHITLVDGEFLCPLQFKFHLLGVKWTDSKSRFCTFIFFSGSLSTNMYELFSFYCHVNTVHMYELFSKVTVCVSECSPFGFGFSGFQLLPKNAPQCEESILNHLCTQWHHVPRVFLHSDPGMNSRSTRPGYRADWGLKNKSTESNQWTLHLTLELTLKLCGWISFPSNWNQKMSFYFFESTFFFRQSAWALQEHHLPKIVRWCDILWRSSAVKLGHLDQTWIRAVGKRSVEIKTRLSIKSAAGRGQLLTMQRVLEMFSSDPLRKNFSWETWPPGKSMIMGMWTPITRNAPRINC